MLNITRSITVNTRCSLKTKLSFEISSLMKSFTKELRSSNKLFFFPIFQNKKYRSWKIIFPEDKIMHQYQLRNFGNRKQIVMKRKTLLLSHFEVAFYRKFCCLIKKGKWISCREKYMWYIISIPVTSFWNPTSQKCVYIKTLWFTLNSHDFWILQM